MGGFGLLGRWPFFAFPFRLNRTPKQPTRVQQQMSALVHFEGAKTKTVFLK